MKDKTRSIQSIEIGGRILEALADTSRPMMLTEISEAADITPAQCHAYLTSLKNVGLIQRDASTGLYTFGHLAMLLGMSWLQSDQQIARAIAELAELSEEFGATALILVWGKLGPTVAHIYAGQRLASLNIRQGSLFSLVGTSGGRVFAAFANSAEVDALLKAELAHAAAVPVHGAELTAEELQNYVMQIRENGYSAIKGAPIPDISTIAVPVFSANGSLNCVLSLYGKANDLAIDSTSSAVIKMVDLAKRLSALQQNETSSKGALK